MVAVIEAETGDAAYFTLAEALQKRAAEHPDHPIALMLPMSRSAVRRAGRVFEPGPPPTE